MVLGHDLIDDQCLTKDSTHAQEQTEQPTLNDSVFRNDTQHAMDVVNTVPVDQEATPREQEATTSVADEVKSVSPQTSLRERLTPTASSSATNLTASGVV